MKYTEENFEKALKLLEEMSLYEGCELGDTWSELTHFWGFAHNYVGEKLQNALKEEILEHANDIDQNYSLVEEEYQPPPRKTKMLIHKDEL